MNHHQLPFSSELHERLGDNYKFVATAPVDKERLNMGYADMNKQYPFILTTYDSESNVKEAMELALSSDVIITGSAPAVYSRERIKQNKLTFKYSERIFRVMSRSLIYLAYLMKNHVRYKNKNLYMLCASAYTAGDFALMGLYKNKTFKWGYFPEVKKYDIGELIGSKKEKDKPIEILWAGRFLDWKHPEKAMIVARQLKHDGYDFKMKMIGSGEEESNINRLIEKHKLDDCVTLLGTMPPEMVRGHMEDANIFLFTSSYHEGWGAVLNEAMNSGCAVVASHAAGAVPFLIKHGENGLVYKNSSNEDLYAQVKKLMGDIDYRERLGYNAYNTLASEWNAEIVAERFLTLCEGLLSGKRIDVESGPCSAAEPIAQHKMFRKVMLR